MASNAERAELDAAAGARPVQSGNCIDGEGKCVWASGDVFEGSWCGGKHHGAGTFTWWKTGSAYTGAWDKGVIHGQGTMRYSSGSAYAGGWARGKPAGEGTWIWPDGVSWTGRWEREC